MSTVVQSSRGPGVSLPGRVERLLEAASLGGMGLTTDAPELQHVLRGCMGMGEPLADVVLERRALRGGLTAASVEHVTARFESPPGTRRVVCFVRKELEGDAVREADIYAHVLARANEQLAPRLIATDRLGPTRVTLYLEAISPHRAWPWRDVDVAGSVLERLARFHAAAHVHDALTWDYDAKLTSLATSTFESLERSRLDPELAPLRKYLAPTKRLVLALSSVRREILAQLGAAPIHGDLHPGNVLVRSSGRSASPVLIDWERARTGAPFEDVSSWLQSLGYWEPEVRRRHDTLLSTYLAARGLSARLTSDVRAGYWLAGASNAFAGALRYHLETALAAASASEKTAAAHAARDWLRIIRRADAAWS